MNTPTVLLMMPAPHSAWTTARISSPCGWPPVAWIGLLLSGRNLDRVAIAGYTEERIGGSLPKADTMQALGQGELEELTVVAMTPSESAAMLKKWC